jgi:hypothetical protein
MILSLLRKNVKKNINHMVFLDRDIKNIYSIHIVKLGNCFLCGNGFSVFEDGKEQKRWTGEKS